MFSVQIWKPHKISLKFKGQGYFTTMEEIEARVLLNQHQYDLV